MALSDAEIQALLNGATSIGGAIFNGGAANANSKLAASGLKNFTDLNVPTLDQLSYTPTQANYLGGYEATTYDPTNVSGNAYDDINVDPATRAQQMAVLSQLSQIANEGGLTAIDKAKIDQINSEADTQAKGQRDAAIQDAQQRGIAGSGLEFASRLAADQGAANSRYTAGTQVAAAAQQRALDALNSSATLAGNVNQQDYTKEAQKAAAANAIKQFNANNSTSAAQAAAAARNTAAGANAAAAQGVSNTNAAAATQAAKDKAAAAGTQFDESYRRAFGASGALQPVAAANTASGKSSSSSLGGLLSAGASLYSAFSDENMKENVDTFDAGKFLDELTGYKYNYKPDTGLDDENHVGVMAQDLEKTPEGDSLVTDTPKGKMVDYGKAAPVMLASMAHLNHRINKLEGK